MPRPEAKFDRPEVDRNSGADHDRRSAGHVPVYPQPALFEFHLAGIPAPGDFFPGVHGALRIGAAGVSDLSSRLSGLAEYGDAPD